MSPVGCHRLSFLKTRSEHVWRWGWSAKLVLMLAKLGLARVSTVQRAAVMVWRRWKIFRYLLGVSSMDRVRDQSVRVTLGGYTGQRTMKKELPGRRKRGRPHRRFVGWCD